MKFLTYAESTEWLKQTGICIDEHRNLSPLQNSTDVMVTLPAKPLQIMSLASRLIEIFSLDTCLMLWLADWCEYPDAAYLLFQRVLRGCGENGSIYDSPGFKANIRDVQEQQIMVGFIFMILSFNWHAFLVSQVGTGYVYFGDAFVVFHLKDDFHVQTILDIASAYKLEVIKDPKQAW